MSSQRHDQFKSKWYKDDDNYIKRMKYLKKKWLKICQAYFGNVFLFFWKKKKEKSLFWVGNVHFCFCFLFKEKEKNLGNAKNAH